MATAGKVDSEPMRSPLGGMASTPASGARSLSTMQMRAVNRTPPSWGTRPREGGYSAAAQARAPRAWRLLPTRRAGPRAAAGARSDGTSGAARYGVRFAARRLGYALLRFALGASLLFHGARHLFPAIDEP